MAAGQDNPKKFNGLAETYHSVRPVLPEFPMKMIQKYLGYFPNTIIDLGCGTGLSTIRLREYGKRIIGIEPNHEMLEIAKNVFSSGLEFRIGSSMNTGLDGDSADVVVCSQSFHWMEPVSALQEISRILKPGGVFAAIDYDWPPVCDWRIEKSFEKLYQLAKSAEKKAHEKDPSFQRWKKETHLSRIQESGQFRYAREIVFSNSQVYTGEQLYQMALTQSRIQTALDVQPQKMWDRLQEYHSAIEKIWGKQEFEAVFCYRMRIAVK